MPKQATFPTLYDKVQTVSISFLIKHEYLKMNQWKRGVITWLRNGNKIGSISISVNMMPNSQFIELDYKCNDAQINYRVQLISAPSNLGKGVVWYFICPKTNKRCRKLYLADTYFYHRSAFRGCMYEKQTYSKLGNAYNNYFGVETLYRELNKKYFKRKYAGKPTKRFLKLTKQIQNAENCLTWY